MAESRPEACLPPHNERRKGVERAFWKGNILIHKFWRAFCDQSITLCAGHRRPSSETKVTSCNSLSFQDFTAILFHVLHSTNNAFTIRVSSCPLSPPRIYCSSNDIFSVPKLNFFGQMEIKINSMTQHNKCLHS